MYKEERRAMRKKNEGSYGQGNRVVFFLFLFFSIFTANRTQAEGLRREAKSDLELPREYSYS